MQRENANSSSSTPTIGLFVVCPLSRFFFKVTSVSHGHKCTRCSYWTSLKSALQVRLYKGQFPRFTFVVETVTGSPVRGLPTNIIPFFLTVSTLDRRTAKRYPDVTGQGREQLFASQQFVCCLLLFVRRSSPACSTDVRWGIIRWQKDKEQFSLQGVQEIIHLCAERNAKAGVLSCYSAERKKQPWDIHPLVLLKISGSHDAE